MLSNAFKFTPEAERISVDLTQKIEDKHTFLEIKITDNSIGIAPQDIENIFTRFYTNKTLKSSDTNGVGLSISKDVIELHYGKISVESALNKGTIFRLKIPINKERYLIFHLLRTTLQMNNS